VFVELTSLNYRHPAKIANGMTTDKSDPSPISRDRVTIPHKSWVALR